MRHLHYRRAALALLAALVVAAPDAALAQRRVVDRAIAPRIGAAPTLIIPSWTTTTLRNGARLVVVPKRDLPLVNVSIAFDGGSYQFEPANKTGLATIVATLLTEGTATRTGDQLSEAQQMLGISIGASIVGERGTIGFQALRDRLAPALALVADVIVNPSFPADALERQRARLLVGLTQSKDLPGVIATNNFLRQLYGSAHPYGRLTTEESIKAVTRDDVVAFHRAYFQPARATIIIAGDIDPATAKAEVERALAVWAAGGAPASFAYPGLPARPARTIYLIDKPKAAQSSVAIGLPGPARDTPDFFAIQVMNRILGGHIQSRLSSNIRETKGWSYGVNSNFALGKGPGAVRAGGDVVAAKTDSALIEFMRELRGVTGEKPFTDAEIAEAKQALIQALPRGFGTMSALSAAVTNTYLFGLPRDYYQTYADRVTAVTRADLDRVARSYVDVDHVAIIVVGDRALVEEPLRRTGIAPVVVLDPGGMPVPVPVVQP